MGTIMTTDTPVVTGTAREAYELATAYAIAIPYVGGFALGGWFLWQPVWRALFGGVAAGGGTALADAAAGFAYAMQLIGPFAGIAVSAVLFARYLDRTSDATASQ